MEHLINLNFAPGGLPATVHVSQYDDTIRQLRFQLWFGRSKVEVPSGASVRVDIKKPDGHIVLVNGTVNSSDRSIVTVPTTKQMTAVPGGSRGTLVVSSTGDKRISSAIFILQVHRDPVEDGDASDSDLSMLQDAIDQTAANASAAQAAATAAQQAASSFTTDTTLSVTGAAADAKKTGDEISAIKADLEAYGLTDDIKEAMIAFFEEIALFEPTAKAKFDTLRALLLGEFLPTWEYLSMDDVFSTVGYTNPSITDGEFTKDGTEPNFSAVVFRPYITHVKMALIMRSNPITSLTPVYKLIDATQIEVMNRFTGRFVFERQNDDTKYTLKSTIENVQRTLDFTETNEYAIEDGTLTITNSDGELVREVQNSNILGFWSDHTDFISQATVEKLSADFHQVTENDVLYHNGETSFSVSDGTIHTVDKSINAVVFKDTVSMFDGRLYSVKNSANAYNTFFIYWANADGTVLHGTDGTKTFIFTYDSSTGVYSSAQATNIGTVTKSETQGAWSNGRTTIWLEDEVLHAMYNGIYITVTDANCIGYWGSNYTGDTYAEGRVM